MLLLQTVCCMIKCWKFFRRDEREFLEIDLNFFCGFFMVSEKDVAIKAAKSAGKILMNFYGKIEHFSLKGSPYNLVTQADLASEKKIVEILKKAFPSYGFMAEEGTGIGKPTENTWIVDPLDGTTNFAHTYPFFCISIALKKINEIVLGVVFDPFKKELFFAEKGKGSYLNGKKIFVSKNDFPKALLVTGFSYERGTIFDLNVENFSNTYKRVHGVRRDGAAALDLAYIACGRFDGYWEFKLKPWDLSAGQLLVKEANGKISNQKNEEWNISNDSIVASNGIIHKELVSMLKII